MAIAVYACPGLKNKDEVTNGSSELYKFEIFPNPAKTILNVNFNNTGNSSCKLIIYDLIGKPVKIIPQITGNNIKFNIESLESGLYTISIYSEKQILHKTKFIVQ